MKILIFIPARGGSKGIPGKNLITLKGKPLIQYTLNTTQELVNHNRYKWLPFISTDDKKIATYCQSQGFHMEYKRPKNLARDKSVIIDAILDGLNWLNKNNDMTVDAVLLLQPTSPLRSVSEILSAIKKIDTKKDFSIASVTRMREHPYECVVRGKEGWKYLVKPDHSISGRQDYKDNFFFIDGSFYFASVNFLNHYKSYLVENKTTFYCLKQRWAIDIDEEQDLHIAETLISRYG